MSAVIVWALALCTENGCELSPNLPLFETRAQCEQHLPIGGQWKDGKRFISPYIWQECWSKKMELWQR